MSHATTPCSLDRCPVLQELNKIGYIRSDEGDEQFSAKKAAIEAPLDGVRGTSESSAQKRRLALPALRYVEQFARPPREIVLHAWRRPGTQSDYLVCEVPRTTAPPL